MNIEIVCPKCGSMFITAVTEYDLHNYEKRISCSFCRKSSFLEKVSWRIPKKGDIRAGGKLIGQKVDSTTRQKARSKWSKKAHSERVKRIKKRSEAKSATSDLEVRELPVLKARSEVSKGE